MFGQAPFGVLAYADRVRPAAAPPAGVTSSSGIHRLRNIALIEDPVWEAQLIEEDDALVLGLAVAFMAQRERDR